MIGRLMWWRPIDGKPTVRSLQRDLVEQADWHARRVDAMRLAAVQRERLLSAARQVAEDRGQLLARVRAVLDDEGLSAGQANDRIRQIVGGPDA